MGKWLSYLFIAAVLLIGWLFLGPRISRPTFGLVRQQGDVINAALEKYRVDHQVYPKTLKALVPEYIESIEKPKKFGRQLRLQVFSSVKWEYKPAEDQRSYYLGITDSSRFGYDSQGEEWTFHPRSQQSEPGT